jgi:ABC-type glycerol-3-phosphate transport system substrate-binding protein
MKDLKKRGNNILKRVLLTLLVLLIAVGFAFAGGQGEAKEALAAAEAEQTGPVTIQWWHAMGGRLGEKVQESAAGPCGTAFA